MTNKNKNSADYKTLFSDKLFKGFINEFEDEFFWIKDNPGDIFFSENILKVAGFLLVK